MKTYLLDIIPKIQRFSQKLNDLTVLLNKHWVILDEESMNKTVFIFREKNNQLLISNNGIIEKGTWDYLGNNSLLIDRESGSYLFKHGFIDENVLALKVDGKEEYALLVNEQWFEKQIKSLESILNFLNEKYLQRPSFVDSKSPTSSNTITIKQEHDPNIPILKNGKYGFVDTDGNTYIPFKYKWAEKFSEELALIKLNGKFGYINNQGDIVIDTIYDGASSFNKGKADVNLNGEHYYIDKNGLKQ